MERLPSGERKEKAVGFVKLHKKRTKNFYKMTKMGGPY